MLTPVRRRDARSPTAARSLSSRQCSRGARIRRRVSPPWKPLLLLHHARPGKPAAEGEAKHDEGTGPEDAAARPTVESTADKDTGKQWRHDQPAERTDLHQVARERARFMSAAELSPAAIAAGGLSQFIRRRGLDPDPIPTS